MNLAIIGATGNVGRKTIEVLEKSEIEIENLYLVASKKSAGKKLKFKNKDIIIVNSFGVLAKYLKYSPSVFIGKSMLKSKQNDSGQNPIEAAKLNCKIYHGPYISNFKEIYALLSRYKICEKINNEKELANKLIFDLKHGNKNFSKKINLINSLGKEILKKSTSEINKIINL